MTRPLLQLTELGLAPVWLRRHVDWSDQLDDVGEVPAQTVSSFQTAANLDHHVAPADSMASALRSVETHPAEQMLARTFASWSSLQQAVSECRLCKLCETRTRTVFGKGNSGARLLLIGEAPGAEEDKQGLPFVGKAGQLLDNMLLAIGVNMDSCYIANVLKCRPPGNRNPAPDEVLACYDYLQAQIAMIKPDVILALGRFAAHSLLQSDEAIGSLRRRQHDYQGIPLHVTFHPAYLLRSPNEKAKAWQDLLAVKKTLQAGN